MFKSKTDKEFEKKMAIKKTINEMNRQIGKLEASEMSFLDIAKDAKSKGLENQLNLAVSGLKQTIAQKKKVQEMLLNFQIMVQTKDMLSTTSEFLEGMGSLSKDMVKLCDEKQFSNVSKAFEKAMYETEAQSEKIDIFMENSKSSFSNLSNNPTKSSISDEEIMSLIDSSSNESNLGNSEIDEKIKEVQKKMAE